MDHGITIGFLLVLSLQDLRRKRIDLFLIGGLCLVGVVYAAMRNGADLMEWLQDLSIGLLLCLLWKLCEGGIGLGDGLTFAGIGLMIGFKDSLIVFLGGIVLCAFAAGIVWMIRRNGKMTLPMIPFFLLAAVLQWSLCW